MPVTDNIRAALEGHLLATTPALPPAAWTNTPFNQTDIPGGGDTYLQVQFAPVQRRPAVRGPDPQYRHSGLFLVTVCVPEDEGSGVAFQLADTLLDRFRVDSPIAGVDVNVSIEYSEPETGFHRPPFFCVPVRVGWFAFK